MVTISSRIKLKHFCFCCYVVKHYWNFYLSGVFNSYVIYEEFIETFKGYHGMCSCAYMGVCVCRSTYMSMHINSGAVHLYISFFFFCDQVFHWSGCHQQTPTNPYDLPVSAYHIWFLFFSHWFLGSNLGHQDWWGGLKVKSLYCSSKCLSFIPCTHIRQLTAVSNFSCSMGSNASGLLEHLHLCIHSLTRTHTQNLK